MVSLRLNAPVITILMIFSVLYEGLYLVKEQPELAFRLSHPLAQAVGPLPHEEGHLPLPLAALVGQRSGHQSLPRTRGTVEQAAPATDREFSLNGSLQRTQRIQEPMK